MTSVVSARPDRLVWALGRLTRPESDAIVLALFTENTYQEVAVLLGEPVCTIEGRIRSGLQRLHQELFDDASPPTEQ